MKNNNEKFITFLSLSLSVSNRFNYIYKKYCNILISFFATIFIEKHVSLWLTYLNKILTTRYQFILDQ